MPTTHSVSRSMQVHMLYKCSHCGEFIVKPVRITAAQSYKNFEFNSQSARDRHYDHSIEEARRKLEGKVSPLMRSPGLEDILYARLPAQYCPKCNRRESWDIVSLQALFHMGCLPLAVILEFQIFPLMAGDTGLFFELFPLTLAAIAALQLARIIYRWYWSKKAEKDIAALPPLFALTIEELERCSKAYEAYAEVDWSEHKLPPHITHLRTPELTPTELQKLLRR